MRNFHIISAAIALGGPAFVILYDLVAKQLGGREATISSVVRNWAEHWTELPYVAAGIMVWLWMHLFFEVIVKHLLTPDAPAIPIN